MKYLGGKSNSHFIKQQREKKEETFYLDVQLLQLADRMGSQALVEHIASILCLEVEIKKDKKKKGK